MNSLLSIVGLAKKANKLVSGEGFVIDNVRSNKAKLVLISSDCQPSTLKKLTDKCIFYKVKYIIVDYDKYELGNSVGKPFRVCVAIIDDGLSNLILKKIKE